MKTTCIILTSLIWAQFATAAESSFIDDAPRGFIHITQPRYEVEVDVYLRADSVVRIEQSAEETDGKLIHYVRLYSIGAGGFFSIEFDKKEDASKCLKRLLELSSETKLREGQVAPSDGDKPSK